MRRPFLRTWPPRPPALRRSRSFRCPAHSGLLGSARTVPWTVGPCGGPVEGLSHAPAWRTCSASTRRRIRAPCGWELRTAGESVIGCGVMTSFMWCDFWIKTVRDWLVSWVKGFDGLGLGYFMRTCLPVTQSTEQMVQRQGNFLF